MRFVSVADHVFETAFCRECNARERLHRDGRCLLCEHEKNAGRPG